MKLGFGFFLFFFLQNLYFIKPLGYRFYFSFTNSSSQQLFHNFDIESFHLPFGNTVMSVFRYFSNIPKFKIGINGLESLLVNSFRTPVSLLT